MQRVTDPLSRPLQAGASTGASDPIVHDGAFPRARDRHCFGQEPAARGIAAPVAGARRLPERAVRRKARSLVGAAERDILMFGQCAVLPGSSSPMLTLRATRCALRSTRRLTTWIGSQALRVGRRDRAGLDLSPDSTRTRRTRAIFSVRSGGFPSMRNETRTSSNSCTHLLALGFQGRYGAVSGGLKRVEAVRRHLFALLDFGAGRCLARKELATEETPLTSRSVRASTNQGLAIASASLIAGLVLGFTTGVWTKAGDATGHGVAAGTDSGSRRCASGSPRAGPLKAFF